jgi:hypothetical protein
MFVTTGASSEELMRRGEWRSVAAAVCNEHASNERDALLAQGLNRYAEGAKVVPLDRSLQPDRARSAQYQGEGEDEVTLTPLLTSETENDEERSGERLELST